MKRLARLFASIAPTAIVIVLLVFWARSYAPGDFLNWHGEPRELEIYSTGGVLRIAYGDMDPSRNFRPTQGWEGSFWPFRRRVDRFEADLRRGTTFGFRYEHWISHVPSLTADAHIVTLPYWFLVLCAAIVPVMIVRGQWRARRRRRRAASGLCTGCGYDLRASAGHCPECGMPVARGSTPMQ